MKALPRKARYLALALMTVCSLAVARDLDQDEALELRQKGVILPLEQLLDSALGRYPGARLLEAELEEKHSKLALQRGRSILDAAKARAEHAGVKAVDEKLRHGQLVESLLELETETRLLVLGKRGFSSAEAHGHMGLHVERVIRSVQKPVLLTQQRYKTPQRIMFAYDGSATALKGLQMLAASPLAQGLPVHLVMAGADDEASRAQMESAAFILRTAGFDTKTAIVSGEPETVLNQYQQEHVIDLMVMGAYGHSRIRQFIVGSTTTGMICKAKCSLLILR